MEEQPRHIHLTETSRIPLDGLILGWGAMMPFPILAALSWWGGDGWREIGLDAARLWGGALLLFFSGVRRGLSFRTMGGPSLRQLAAFAALFGAGLVVLLVPGPGALGIVAVALAALAFEDVRAAQRGEVPLYFRRLRPAQMTFGAASVLLCWLTS